MKSTKITLKKISDLKPYENNARTHDGNQIKQIAASIQEFGFTNPVLIDAENVIIAGHGRVLAAKSLDMENVPCLILDELTDRQKRAYIIADNKLALNAGWNDELLAKELSRLKSEDFDLDLIGFSDEELNDIVIDFEDGGEGSNTDDDNVPEVDESEAICKIGDLWQLGDHRLLCGDSTKKDDVDRLMDGEKADMIFTDPPYGVNYISRVDKNKRKAWGSIKNDDLSGKELNDFLSSSINQDIMNIDSKYIWCNWQSVVDFIMAIGRPNNIIVWNKESIGLGSGYRQQHEFCLFYGKIDDNSESNVWNLKRDSTSDYKHPTQKPVALCERAIKNSRPKKILDLFLGSGSTLIACEKTKRKCYGMELDPKYCDVIIKRWEEYTGKKAVKL